MNWIITSCQPLKKGGGKVGEKKGGGAEGGVEAERKGSGRGEAEAGGGRPRKTSYRVWEPLHKPTEKEYHCPKE